MRVELENFLAEVDVFPVSGPAFRNEPAEVTSLITPRGRMKFLRFCSKNLTTTQDIADYVRTEVTEKGHLKFTSLLWGTLVVKPCSQDLRQQYKREYREDFPEDLHYSVNPSNLRVDGKEGTITFWRYEDERDELGPTEHWLERFWVDHMCLGNGDFV